jgi:hypothetical protein
MQTISKAARRRIPNGIDKRAIAMRLMPNEREQFDDLAKQHHLTDGALAREIYLLGLPLWQAAHASA